MSQMHSTTNMHVSFWRCVVLINVYIVIRPAHALRTLLAFRPRQTVIEAQRTTYDRDCGTARITASHLTISRVNISCTTRKGKIPLQHQSWDCVTSQWLLSRGVVCTETFHSFHSTDSLGWSPHDSRAHKYITDSVISGFDDYAVIKSPPATTSISDHMAFEELFGTYELGQYIFGFLSARDLLNAQKACTAFDTHVRTLKNRFTPADAINRSMLHLSLAFYRLLTNNSDCAWPYQVHAAQLPHQPCVSFDGPKGQSFLLHPSASHS